MEEKNQNMEDFTAALAVTDAVPVLLFGLSGKMAAKAFPNRLFRAGIVVCTAAGTSKVIWKFLLAVTHRDRKPLNQLFHIGMPCGFAVILTSLLMHRKEARSLFKAAFSRSHRIFFLLSASGVAAMAVMKSCFDSRSARANWAEQSVNIFAQSMLLTGVYHVWSDKTSGIKIPG